MIVDFSKYGSIKIGGEVSVVEIENKGFVSNGFFVVGNGCNLLVSPKAKTPLAILSDRFNYARIEGNELIAGGKMKSGGIVSLCRQNDLGGLEFLRGLPGSVGGMIAMNAGVKKNEIFDRLEWIDFGGGRVDAAKIVHGYRFAAIGGVVYEAGFRLKKGYDRGVEAECLALRSHQPNEPSLGSCFKNPSGDYAGRLIESVGLKGFQIGSAAFSEKHANFLINRGGAAFEDAIALIDEAKRRVFETHAIELETEIKIIE